MLQGMKHILKWFLLIVSVVFVLDSKSGRLSGPGPAGSAVPGPVCPALSGLAGRVLPGLAGHTHPGPAGPALPGCATCVDGRRSC